MQAQQQQQADPSNLGYCASGSGISGGGVLMTAVSTTDQQMGRAQPASPLLEIRIFTLLM